MAEKVVFEDLKGGDLFGFTKLSLTRVDRYLNGPIPDYKTDVVTSDQINQTAQLMRDGVQRWDGKPRLLDSATAVKILGELRPGGALMKGSQHENTTRKKKSIMVVSSDFFWYGCEILL
jgi:transcription initiation factor TFIIH subunit 1